MASKRVYEDVAKAIRETKQDMYQPMIEQPSFLEDVSLMTYEREPGKATFIHYRNKQLSLFE